MKSVFTNINAKNYSIVLIGVIILLSIILYYLLYFFSSANKEVLFEEQLLLSRIAVLVILGLSLYTLFFPHRDKVIDLFTRQDTPENLGIFRILFFLTPLLYFAISFETFTHMIYPWVHMPEGNREGLFLIGDMYNVLPLNETIAVFIGVLWWLSALFSLIGLFTNLSIALFALSTFYILGIPQFHGEVNHTHYLIWFSFILACSPCGDAFSIDLLRKGQYRYFIPVQSTSYTLPLSFIALLLGIIYFFPGFWKIWSCGLDWGLTDNLQNHLHEKWRQFANWKPIILIDNFPFLYRSAGLSTILIETSFLFLIFFPVARPLIAIGGLIFHIFIYIFLNIFFLPLTICYASFLNVKMILPKTITSNNLSTSNAIDSPPNNDKKKVYIMATKITGIGLLVINTALGFGKITDSWPFACYPLFNYFVPPTIKQLAYYENDRDSLQYAVSIMQKEFKPNRYRELERKLIEAHEKGDYEERNRRIDALESVFKKYIDKDSTKLFLIETPMDPKLKDSIIRKQKLGAFVIK